MSETRPSSAGKGAPQWERGWRIGYRHTDLLRSLRCVITRHDWKVNERGTQRVCERCWTAQDRAPQGCPGKCIAHIDCTSDDLGCNYPEPHIHGFACDKTCSRCHGRGIPVSDPENHPNHENWRTRA